MKSLKMLLIFSLSLVICFKSKIIETSNEIEGENFSCKAPVRLKHLIIHKDDGRVFISGENELFQFLPNLSLVNLMNISDKNTNDYNKILLIDYQNSNLISCWSDTARGCTIYNAKQYHPLNSTSQKFSEVITAISANASTVAFISGDNQNHPNFSMLFVGASYNSNLPNQYQVPAVALRSLKTGENYLKVRENGSTQILFDEPYRNEYIVKYVYGFSSGNYGYFLTTQRNSTTQGSPYISKIIRICNALGKHILEGYAEIPIECAAENGHYNLVQAGYVGKPGSGLVKSLNIKSEDDVLFAVFSKSQTHNSSEPRANSTLCIYSLDAINRKFTESMQTCFNGVGKRGLEFIKPEEACIKDASFSTIDRNCFRSSKNMPFGGSEPVSGYPVSFFNEIPTAITSTKRNNANVIFIGTNTGHLLTFTVSDVKTKAYEQVRKKIEENSSVNSDLLFSPDEQHLYIMTKKTVIRIKVPDIYCGAFTTYDSCLEYNTTVCGWCEFSGTCTNRTECARFLLGLWWQYDFRKNVSIANISSRAFVRTFPEEVKLTIVNVPKLSNKLNCNFNILNKTYTKIAESNYMNQGNTIRCLAPATYEIPPISLGYNYLEATLQIGTTDIPNIISTNIIFFDCNTYNSCEKCLSQSFKCGWLNSTKRCIYLRTSQHKAGDAVTKNSDCPSTNISHKPENGPESCNALKTYDECIFSNSSNCGWCRVANKCTLKNDCSSSTKSSWIIANVRPTFSISKKQISFPLSILQSRNLQGGNSDTLQLFLDFSEHSSISGDEFYCKITFENSNITIATNATLSNKTSTNYAIDCKVHNLNVNFSILHFNHYTIAKLTIGMTNISDICTTHIKFFDCESFNSCQVCFSSEFGCQWHPNERICAYNATNPRRHNTICPNSPPPSISSIKPEQGPWEGGTNLTILGQSLGYAFEDISHGNITVAGILCTPYKEMYTPMKKIVCKINRLNLSKIHEGPVELPLNGLFLKSQQIFKFVNPKISEIFPKEGPLYGGTELTIKGENLDAGRSVDISVGNKACPLLSRTSIEMKCITDSSAEKKGEVIVQFDNNIRKSANSSYRYIKDPERDENGFNIAPKGIPSGGVSILLRNITFTRQTSTQELQFQVHFGNKNYTSSCTIQNYSAAICPSPNIPDIDRSSFNAGNPIKLDFSLKHSTEIVRIISNSHNHSMKFTLYPDPEFYNFINSSVEFNGNKYAIIKGRYINNACQKIDITVEVGNITCQVISITSQQIICVLPKPHSSDPEIGFDEEYDILAQYENITVKIGDKFKRIVSKQREEFGTQNNKWYIYIIVICIVLLLILIISFVVIGQKVKANALKKLKETQKQMDKLELCVASECKEAFTELQTQITTFTSHNFYNSLPFLDYRSYVINILFPNINNHSFIFCGKAILIHKEQELQLFSELIKNRRFLLSFVRTLESSENFSINDRVYVASMIMTTLQKDMDYCTDILKTLMVDLIEKYTKGNNNPKLLFRRTESVVEKMLSAWFGFLLYKFLRETAGYPLINLFSAIKQQVNKGPVDMITSDAQYCLNENKMIRQKIDFCPITVFVNVPEKTAPILKLESKVEEIQVKVLDCDTISQAKEKITDIIYNTNYYSQRPNPSEICIEWLTGSSDGMILYDDDYTSKIEGEWRQINTLRHYGVVDGSRLNLISLKEAEHRTSDSPFFKALKLQTDYICKLPISHHNQKKIQLSESTIPLIQVDDTHCKEWHLVKPFSLNSNQEGHVGGDQIVPEIYLLRLLTMKNSLQKFVNDLFETILKKKNQKNCFPMAIKYMFDFLDSQASQHGITDPEVVHIWKNNCLHLRFWVNLIKNPNFLFDIHKSNTVDSCLSVIAQLLMDSCSTTELYLGKDSATSKLLYAKELPFYKKWVEKYYAEIKKLPAISPRVMNEMLLKESQEHANDFDTYSSVHELLKYALNYKEKLIATLKDDESAQEHLLAVKLEAICDSLSSNTNF